MGQTLNDTAGPIVYGVSTLDFESGDRSSNLLGTYFLVTVASRGRAWDTYIPRMRVQTPPVTKSFYQTLNDTRILCGVVVIIRGSLGSIPSGQCN